jgi:RNA-directed DNA polymerase
MEEIVLPANMKRAWSQVKRNKGAPGIDGVTIEAFAKIAPTTWPKVKTALLEGRYKPSPVRQVAIPKRDGSERLLGIPTVQDRLIQQAVLQILTPIFDPTFSESSFGFRPGRSAHEAVKRVKRAVKAGSGIAVDLDLEKFFDRVQHDVLMARVARRVEDRRVLILIGRFLRAGLWVGGLVEPRTKGTPQGGPASPLLANILWMTSTASSNAAACTSHGTPTTSSFSFAAGLRASG